MTRLLIAPHHQPITTIPCLTSLLSLSYGHLPLVGSDSFKRFSMPDLLQMLPHGKQCTPSLMYHHLLPCGTQHIQSSQQCPDPSNSMSPGAGRGRGRKQAGESKASGAKRQRGEQAAPGSAPAPGSKRTRQNAAESPPAARSLFCHLRYSHLFLL